MQSRDLSQIATDETKAWLAKTLLKRLTLKNVDPRAIDEIVKNVNISHHKTQTTSHGVVITTFEVFYKNNPTQAFTECTTRREKVFFKEKTKVVSQTAYVESDSGHYTFEGAIEKTYLEHEKGKAFDGKPALGWFENYLKTNQRDLHYLEKDRSKLLALRVREILEEKGEEKCLKLFGEKFFEKYKVKATFPDSSFDLENDSHPLIADIEILMHDDTPTGVIFDASVLNIHTGIEKSNIMIDGIFFEDHDNPIEPIMASMMLDRK